MPWAPTRTRPAPPASRPVQVELGAYVLAGMFYGAAGAFISAQTGSADPLIGRPMLLQIFTAVVLGGTLLGGGRGGCLGTVVGAYTLVLVVNILLVLNVSAYYSSVAEGTILVLAVLAASLNRRSAIADYLRLGWLKLRARRDGTLPSAHPAPSPAVRPAASRRGRGARRMAGAPPRAAALHPAGLCRVRRRARRDPSGLWQHADQSRLLQLADRPGLVPGRAGAGPGGGDPHRRPRPVGALDDRPVRHPGGRAGARLGRGGAVGDPAGLGAGHRPRCRSTAPASCCWACRRSS